MKKILIIEDDSFVSRMYERAFKIGGYEVEVEANGEAGLARLRSDAPKPSVIVMDVMMPGMNGVELLTEIKKDPSTSSIPLAVLTNSFTKETADHFITLGADLYLVKIAHSSKDIVQRMDDLIAKAATK